MEPRTSQLRRNTAEEARKSRKSPRMGGTAFFRITFPDLSHFIRVPSRDSRAKSRSGLTGRKLLPSTSRSGVALVIVLGFLVLITVVIVAFLTSVSTEHSTASSAAAGATGREMADASVQLVMGQIREATSLGPNVAWASQPGMIRTYGSGGAGSYTASSSPLAYYKLYSSDNMIVDSAAVSSFDPASDAPKGWDSQPAVFTDLNAPVTSSSTSTSYPIVDPRAADAVNGYSMVEGFSINATTTPTATASTTNPIPNQAPMPVKWIYVLRDGTQTAPAGGNGTGNIADFSNAPAGKKPTADNPIVGRIAFWTDDETCKLNLNTAAGGVPWDAPTYTAGMELHYSRYKPVKDEFARYPGHPATTSLVPVLWSFGGLSSPDQSLQPSLNPPMTSGNYYLNIGGNTAADVAKADVTPTLSTAASQYWQKILSLSPRNTWGGSRMGSNATVIESLQSGVAQGLDSDRLFASVDEAFFGVPNSSADPRPVNPFSLTSSDLGKLRFFLTTQSRAPDTNPLNQPKVGIWPVAEPKKNPANPNSLSDPRTPTDKLMAFCSTLNNNAYYFTRNNPDSATADFQPTSRNSALFDYLQSSMSRAIPGFGNNLQARYGADGLCRILTLCYDYIRSVNLTDTFDYNYVDRFNNQAPFAFVPPRSALRERGRGQVVPIQISKGGRIYKGLGRFVTIKQAGLHFIAVAANQPPCVVDPATGIPSSQPNPMHPWIKDPPNAVTLTDAGNGTWSISAGGSEYPTINGQTHAGMPLLSTKWISDSGVLTSANATLRDTILNPRYQGPTTSANGTTLYAASSPGGNSTNSQVLPASWPTTSPGKLGPHQTLIQAAFLVDPVVCNPGNPPYVGKYRVRVRGLENFKADGTSLGFGADLTQLSLDTLSTPSANYNSTVLALGTFRRSSVSGILASKLTFISTPVMIGPANQGASFSFTGGNITLEITTDPASGPVEVIQSFAIEFPSTVFPTPLLAPMPVVYGNPLFSDRTNTQASGNYTSTNSTIGGIPAAIQDLTPSSMLAFDEASGLAKNPNFGVGSDLFATATRGAYFLERQQPSFPQRMTDPAVDPYAKLSADTVRSVEVLYGDTRVSGLQQNVPSSFFKPHKYYYDVDMRAAHTFRDKYGYNLFGATDHGFSSSLIYTAPYKTGQFYNDNYRGVPATADPKIRELGAHLSRSTRPDDSLIRSRFPNVTSSVDPSDPTFSSLWRDGGDYDTGPGLIYDGPYIGKPTEGGQNVRFLGVTYDGANTNPDFAFNTFDFPFSNLMSGPNKQIPSPVVFGSLPVGNTPATSWRTLLFCPNPNSQTHLSLSEVPAAGTPPSAGTAPDYLWLDFFNMPVVEPYAISEPFSTAGRVNMNYQLAPFTYIRRDSALRGVLRSTVLTAVEDRRAESRKSWRADNTYVNADSPPDYTSFLQSTGHWAFRFPIHVGETLKQFEDRFSRGDIFRSPAEICALWLYPAKQPTASQPENPATALVNWDAQSSNIKSWWYDNPGSTSKSVTADNMRERPYAALYPLLTTKSNTYTVHFRAQVLKKIPGTDVAQWVENKDVVASEFRGSSLIERYIDPSDPNLPDFATTPNATLDNYYKFRVVSTKKFTAE